MIINYYQDGNLWFWFEVTALPYVEQSYRPINYNNDMADRS